MDIEIYDRIRKFIEDETRPACMSQRDALDIYQELATDLQGWIEAIESEIC